MLEGLEMGSFCIPTRKSLAQGILDSSSFTTASLVGLQRKVVGGEGG